MAYYRLTELSFVDGSLREEDEIVEYNGDPSENMAPATKAQWEAQQRGVPVGMTMAGFTAIGGAPERAPGIDPDAKWFDGHPLLDGAGKDPLHARKG